MNEVDIILELVLSSTENSMLGNIIFMFYKYEYSIHKLTKIEALTTFIYSFIEHSFHPSLKLCLYDNNKLIQTYSKDSRLDGEDIYNFLLTLVFEKGEQE